MYKHVLIATDGSELSERAVREGIDLAKAIGANVTLLTASVHFHIFETNSSSIISTRDSYAADCQKRARAAFASGEKYAQSAGVKLSPLHVFADHPFQAIIDEAAKNSCDLVVMASHGRRGVSGMLLGSETTKVLTHSKVPVLVCR
jgi:nucleotide-binding universal stress UspA family protein